MKHALVINPSVAEAGIFWESYITTTAADVLAPFVAGTFLAMGLFPDT